MIYDAIVLGLGGVGSAALYHLARRGARVVGLDRFPPGHDRGSSHGRTRIIRQAYFEHPDYVPLVRRAYELWAELSQSTGHALYHEVGLLQVGPPDGQVVPGVLASARLHGLPLESLSAAEIERRFPGFRVPPGHCGLLEQRAGYLEVERCVLAHIAAAGQHGAEMLTDAAVTSWSEEDGVIRVATAQGVFRAKRLVVTAGPWAGELLAGLCRLEVRRKVQLWYEAASPAYLASGGCPAFLFETERGVFYGVPRIDDWGVKVAEHTGGEPVVDPLAVDRGLHATDREGVEDFIDRCLPGVSRRLLHWSVCMYTLSPDEHFIVDRHPRHENVVFAAGLSGHGFKFTCVLGESLADLALRGGTQAPIGFLQLKRFGEQKTASNAS